MYVVDLRGMWGLPVPQHGGVEQSTVEGSLWSRVYESIRRRKRISQGKDVKKWTVDDMWRLRLGLQLN